MTERLPQTYQQITDVINLLRRVHADISKLCKAASATLVETKVGLLLETLAERQRHLAEFFSTSQHGAGDKILETWIQFVPSEHVQQQLQAMQGTETSAKDLPMRIVKVQQEIAELVSVLQDESSAEEVKEFLQAISDREHAEAKSSSEAVLGMEDM